MIVEIGHLLAFLALATAAMQAWAGFFASGQPVQRLALLAFGLAGASFVCLIISCAALDFSVALVAQHSSSQQPMLYRIASAWGNHEGSMLLWCLIMAGYGAAASLAMRADALRDRALGVQGLLQALSLAYLVFASSPFRRLDPAPLDGSGLNPLLQDPAVAFHPPMLYMGYVGFSFVFSLAAAGLILGRIDRDWARRARPWALAAWSAITVGITLGAVWAYYELGWGGWWFWDPVENASFMPWLVGAALVHSIAVTEKRGGLAAWTAFLASTAFCLSLLGAFLVRSGVLTSVHAFALDPKRGMLLLGGLGLAAGGAFALFAWRAPSLQAGKAFDPVSREGLLVLNNLFLAVGAATVLFGTLTPLVAQAVGVTMSVGEPWFHATLVPMMGVLFLFMPFGPMATWGKMELKPLLRRLAPAAIAGVLVGAASFAVYRQSVWILPGVALGVWMIGGVATDLVRRAGGGGLRQLARLTMPVWGMAIAHAGLGVFVIGAVSEAAVRTEQTFALAPGETATLRGRSFTFEGVTAEEGPNYYAQRAKITSAKGGDSIVLFPEKRFYPVGGQATTEVGIRKTLTGDIYVALGESLRGKPGAWTLRVAYHPLIDWVFGGAALIALGAFCSLAGQVRLGFARRRQAAVAGGDRGDADIAHADPAGAMARPAEAAP